METARDMGAKIDGNAGADEAFRERLLADPKGAIGDELGVTLPAALVLCAVLVLVAGCAGGVGAGGAVDGNTRLEYPIRLDIDPALAREGFESAVRKLRSLPEFVRRVIMRRAPFRLRVVYDGATRDGLAHGQGVMTITARLTHALTFEARHEGFFRYGHAHGAGVMTMSDGTRIEGEWRYGELVTE